MDTRLDRITISELETLARVGVTDRERAEPQRLGITVVLRTDFARARISDSLADTIDYDAVRRRILESIARGTWRLIETMAEDLAEMILAEFRPQSVAIEIKKFVMPAAGYVSVTLERPSRMTRD